MTSDSESKTFLTSIDLDFNHAFIHLSVQKRFCLSLCINETEGQAKIASIAPSQTFFHCNLKLNAESHPMFN